jgi:hypothetical protein
MRVAVGTFLFWLAGLWLSYGLGRFELFVDGRSVRLDSWEFLTHAARVHGTFWLCSTASSSVPRGRGAMADDRARHAAAGRAVERGDGVGRAFVG